MRPIVVTFIAGTEPVTGSRHRRPDFFGFRLTDLVGDRLGGVAGEGFGERHVKVVAVGRAAVVGAQLGEHRAVVVGVADAFEDDVMADIEA
jgi:hypothetical protein